MRFIRTVIKLHSVKISDKIISAAINFIELSQFNCYPFINRTRCWGEEKKKKGIINEYVRYNLFIKLKLPDWEKGGKKKRKNDLSIVYRLFSFVIKCKRAPRILKSTIIIAAVQFPSQAREKKKKSFQRA